MTTLKDYISKIRAEGYRSFTVANVAQDLKLSKSAVISKCKRLKDKGELLSPVKGFYVIIPPEYQAMGSPPVDELIPLLMKHLSINYYVCLLSAAFYHGSSHQKPQVFQIMVDRRMRGIHSGKIQTKIIYKKSLKNLSYENKETKTGYLKVAYPELTVMDLLLYPKHSGGLNNIATILTELIEKVDPEKLIQLATTVRQKIWLQRLGYILEQIEPFDQEPRDLLVDKLKEYLKDKSIVYIPLSPEVPMAGCPRNRKWKIIINATVEADQ